MVKMELTLKNLILTMVHVHQAKSLPPLSPRLLALPPASDLPYKDELARLAGA